MTETGEVSRLYLDANVFIYAIEGDAALASPVLALFELFRVKKGMAVTSELTLAEVLVKAPAFERRNYLNLIVWSGLLDLHPVSREILIETANYRKQGGMPKLPDAIHVVTAIRAGCRTIVSADSRMRLPVGYALISPDPSSLNRLIRDMS